MKVTNGEQIWSELKAKCSDKMYEAIITLRDKLDAKYGEGKVQYIFDAKYGEGKVQYIFEYSGIDEEGTESIGIILAGAIVSFGTIEVTKDGKVIM